MRVCASIIDAVLLLAIIAPILSWIYGADLWVRNGLFRGPADFLIAWILPAIAVVPFWIYHQATPGKLAIGARIVDAATGGKPSTSQLVGRYLAFCLSAAPLLLGFIWVGCNQRKQGFHDLLARTVVVRAKPSSAVEVGTSDEKQ